MRPRERGECPVCGKRGAIKRGSGPYANGQDETMLHKLKNGDSQCPGGFIFRPEPDAAPGGSK